MTKPIDNPEYRKFRLSLIVKGYQPLWFIYGEPQGLDCDLEGFATEQGGTVFQIWGNSFEIYTQAPTHTREQSFAWLTEGKPR